MRGLAATTVMLLIAALLSITTAVIAAPAASAVAGNPGVPQAPTVVYDEDFENGTGVTQTLLTDYVGAHPVGQKYTADDGWLIGCNGMIVEFNTPYTELGNCANTSDTQQTRQLAYALGAHDGATNPGANHAVTAYTDNSPGPGAIEFQTVEPIPLADSAGRFLTFSVDTSAVNCGVSAPRYNFFLLDGTAPTAVGGEINACTATTTETAPAVGTLPARSLLVGTYTSAGSVLFGGTSAGIRMTNANGSGGGNDAAFDNVRMLDVTPQLDKAFSPTAASTGATSKLTFTFTNTSELAAKNGWSFTDNLPDGLTLATPTAQVTDCPSGVITAADGGKSIAVTGNLSAGMSSCTVTADVTSVVAGTYTNGPGNVTTSGLNPPGPATVTFAPGAAWECTTFGYLFQGTGGPTSIYQVDLVSGNNTQIGLINDNVNATGFNPTDNYVYGVDYTTDSIVQIAADGTLTQLPDPTGWTPGGFNVGDFDDAGHYWISTSNVNAAWYEIDYRAGSSTFGQILATGTTSATTANGSDWVYIDGGLYSLDPSGHLIKFDTTTYITTDLGALAGVTASGYGAGYADASGNVYFSNNETGQIYRVDIKDRTAIVVSGGPTSTGNDGARCASAPIPTVTVTKTVAGRLAAADQFTVGLDESSRVPKRVAAEDPPADDLTVLTSATTTGTNAKASTTDWPVSQDQLYTITDAMTADSPGELSSYTPTIACTDSAGAALTTGGTVGAWTLLIPGSDAYTCNVTNTAKSPSIGLVKHAGTPVDVNHDGLVDAGDTIEYTFTVTNTGELSLQHIAVDDSKVPGVRCPEGPLAVGASVTCTSDAPYTITTDDEAAGGVDNTATGSGNPTGGDPVNSAPSKTHTPTVAAAPGITVVKSATPSDAAHFTVGQVVTYSFVLTNTGNVALTNVHPTETSFTGSGAMSAPACPVDTPSLAPGNKITCTASYTLTRDDVDEGFLTNNATATGTPPNGPPTVSPEVGVTIPADQKPALSLVKSASPATITKAGETVQYSFLITNTGNVTLTSVAPLEGDFSGSGKMSDIVCPDSDAKLRPGAHTICTATYVATQSDVDAGTIRNTATAVGTPPTGGTTPASPPSTALVVVPAKAAMTVAKTVDTKAITAAGQKLTYSFLVSNTGNVSVWNVSVAEGTFSGTGKLGTPVCPGSGELVSLAPGAQLTCTAIYVVTDTDLTAGDLANTATAEGTAPYSAEPTRSLPSTVTIPVVIPVAVVIVPLTPLAATGISALPQLLFGGTILLLLGGFILLVGLRRRRTS